MTAGAFQPILAPCYRLRPHREMTDEESAIIRSLAGPRIYRRGKWANTIETPENVGWRVEEVCAELGLRLQCASGPAYVPEVDWAEVRTRLLRQGEAKPDAIDMTFDYQRDGVVWSANHRASALWWPGGAGKSLACILAALSHVKSPFTPIVFVTKAGARGQWGTAIKTFTKLDPLVMRPLDGLLEVPDVARDLLRVRGLGPKTIMKLVAEGIFTVDQLRDAIARDHFKGLKGFGWKAQKNYAAGLTRLRTITESLDSYLDRMRIAKKRPVIVVAWTSLREWWEPLSRVLSQGQGVLVGDELHVAKASKRQRVKVDVEGTFTYTDLENLSSSAAKLSRSARVRIGASVGPDTQVQLRGGVYGSGWAGRVETAWEMARSAYPVVLEGIHLIAQFPDDVQSRGWTGEAFAWRPMKSIVSHSGILKACSQVRAAGRTTLLTNDHSMFTVESAGVVQRKPVPKIVETATERVTDETTLLYDTGAGWDAGIAPERVYDMLARDLPKNACVCVDLTGHTKESIGVDWQQWNRSTKAKGKLGPYLPAHKWREHADKLPVPTKLYQWGKSYGDWIAPQIKLSDYAYLLGLYLGDGWVGNHGRVGYIIRPEHLERFTAAVSTMPNLAAHVRIVSVKAKCIEIGWNNQWLAKLLKEVMIQAAGTPNIKAKSKRIPQAWIFTWPLEARRELLRGIMDSDGHVTTDQRRARKCIVTTCNRGLAEDYALLLTSVGYFPRIGARKAALGGVVEGRQITGGKSYAVGFIDLSRLTTTGRAAYPTKFRWGATHVYELSVQEVSAVKSPRRVYDLEAREGHPSFTANGILVHNTATSIKDRLRDLWAQLDWLEPGAWGTSSTWLRRFCAATEGQYGGLITTGIAEEHVEELNMRLSFLTHVVDYATSHSALIGMKRRESWRIGPDEMGAGWDPARLRAELKDAKGSHTALVEVQMAAAAATIVEPLIERIKNDVESNPNVKICVFDARHANVDMLSDSLRKALGNVEVLGVHGGNTTPEKREKLREHYMAHPGPIILVATGESVGTGIDLHDTDLGYLTSLPWTLGELHQWEQRWSRHGQRRPCRIVYCIPVGSVTEHLANRLISKMPAIEKVSDNDEIVATGDFLSGTDNVEKIAENILAVMGGIDPDLLGD